MSLSFVFSMLILCCILIWLVVVIGVLVVVVGGVGFFVVQGEGFVSGLFGVLFVVFFFVIIGISILIVNCWYGDLFYVQFFFVIVFGGWLLKLGVFVLVMILFVGQLWFDLMVFFLLIVVGVLMFFVIDVVVFMQMWLLSVSDIMLLMEVLEDCVFGMVNYIDEGFVEEGLWFQGIFRF